MYRTVDVRIVAATHKNLVDEIKVGKFREDLYYRLNVIPIHIPPLRQRHEDIVVLARHFLNKFSEKNGKMINGFTPAAIEKLMGLSWKGNVRELQNVIERSVVLAADSMIGENDIPVALDVEDEGQLLDHVSRGMPTLKDFEHR